MSNIDDSIIIEALDALNQGESVQSILARNQENESELLPILETAAGLQRVKIAHSLEAQARSRERFLARAEALRTGGERPKAFFGFFRRLAVSAVPVLVVLVLLGAGLVLASRSALPGDVLYGAKRTIEDVRFALTSGSQAREELNERFEQERIREINALLRSGKSADVEFKGVLEVIEDESWIVSGVRVLILPETRILGEPGIGFVALVEGRTVEGQLIGREISIAEGSIELPDVMTTPTIDRQTGDDEQDSSPTPSATSDPSPTATDTATATATPTPTATATATPSPSATPSPDVTRDEYEVEEGSGDDNSGPGGGDDSSGPGGGTDDNSGPGGSDDSSGPGGGSDDRSGSGDDDDYMDGAGESDSSDRGPADNEKSLSIEVTLESVCQWPSGCGISTSADLIQAARDECLAIVRSDDSQIIIPISIVEEGQQ